MTQGNRNIKAKPKQPNSSVKVKSPKNKRRKQVNRKQLGKKRQLPNQKKRLARKRKSFKKIETIVSRDSFNDFDYLLFVGNNTAANIFFDKNRRLFHVKYFNG